MIPGKKMSVAAARAANAQSNQAMRMLAILGWMLGCVIGVALRFDSRAELWPEIGVRFELIRRHGRHGLTQEMFDLLRSLRSCAVASALFARFFLRDSRLGSSFRG